MKSYSLLLGLCVLPLCACGAADDLDSSTVGAPGTLQAVGDPEPVVIFDTDDAHYRLGEHQNDQGQRVNIEVIYDTSASYLTPQEPNTSWIVDRALAQTQQRSLLLNDVAALGLYVQDCATGQWLNAACTEFAPDSELLLGIFDGQYLLGHFYPNIETNGLFSEQFECPRNPPSLAEVTLEGDAREVQRVGDVHFAYIVEHRE